MAALNWVLFFAVFTGGVVFFLNSREARPTPDPRNETEIASTASPGIIDQMIFAVRDIIDEILNQLAKSMPAVNPDANAVPEGAPVRDQPGKPDPALLPTAEGAFDTTTKSSMPKDVNASGTPAAAKVPDDSHLPTAEGAFETVETPSTTKDPNATAAAAAQKVPDDSHLPTAEGAFETTEATTATRLPPSAEAPDASGVPPAAEMPPEGEIRPKDEPLPGAEAPAVPEPPHWKEVPEEADVPPAPEIQPESDVPPAPEIPPESDVVPVSEVPPDAEAQPVSGNYPAADVAPDAGAAYEATPQEAFPQDAGLTAAEEVYDPSNMPPAAGVENAQEYYYPTEGAQNGSYAPYAEGAANVADYYASSDVPITAEYQNPAAVPEGRESYTSVVVNTSGYSVLAEVPDASETTIQVYPDQYPANLTS